MIVLVVAAHGDDETLGAGGVMARHVRSGDTVHALILSRGGTSRNGVDLSLIDKIHESTLNAAKIIGFIPRWENFPDQLFDTVSQLEINKTVERHIKEINPNIIYTHHNDLNLDHRITHDAVVVATRTKRINVHCFEVPSSTELSETPFMPNYWVDITSTLDLKKRACLCYNSEMRESPHARSLEYIEALATIRGGQANVKYAEAFSTVKRLG